MTLPDQPPKLSKWFFLFSDALLIGVAAFIARHSTSPLSPTAILAIVGCVVIGAVITAWAFIADYTRKQDEALDDRQRALEALARTVATSAEQISIAASGLHGIVELTQKNLRHAEQLPHKLQDKIAEFQAQLANANDVEKEELEKELVALRTTESERLESVSDKISKSTAEWAKLETSAQKHLAAASAAIAQAATTAAQSITDAQARATAALDAKFSHLATTAKADAPAAVAPPPAAVSAPADTPASPAAESTAHPPKRPRKPRRETPAIEEAAAEPAPAPDAPAPTAPPPEEPPPIVAEAIPEIAPVAPHTAEPFVEPAAESSPPPSPTPTEPSTATDAPKPARKRAPKKPAPETEPTPTLDLKETPAAQSAEVVERVRTSDGATRLLVTAYIGIGNRLFVRGEGPGLNWDKGVPLQFVSIGKWRWETNAASAPVKFKLYKNDDVECAALGTQTLDPGQQQEVTATF
ncbi:MAG: hypothetical protein EXS32_02385 [Opitutus sp.]|nr:hypothetical protein [Opitutus sp.]